MNEVYYTTTLLLGGNEGDVKQTIINSIDLLQTEMGSVVAKSLFYQSPPWGFEHALPFVNMAVMIRTALLPQQQLECCLSIENRMGRKRNVATGYQARPIDIDILFIDNLCIELSNLIVPHPLLTQRRFVLVPLHEIMPQFIHPQRQMTITDLLGVCPDTSEVTLC